MVDGRQAKASRLGCAPTGTGQALGPYGKNRAEIKGLDPSGHVAQLMATDAFQGTVGRFLRVVEAKRPLKGPAPLYSSEELEAVLIFKQAVGVESVKDARNRLAGDRGIARQVLGFDKPRALNGRRVRTLRGGVPSESTLSRHRKRFSEERRARVWKRLERRLARAHLSVKAMQEEARVLHMDGSTILTHHVCPKIDKKSGKVVNQHKVTCPDGGYIGAKGPQEKRGHGYTLVSAVTATAVPVAWEVTPLSEHEGDPGLRLLKGDLWDELRPHLAGTGKLGVLSADGLYKGRELRAAARELGLIENIHPVAHGKQAAGRAAAHRKQRIKIERYPNWFSDGHRQLVCTCGKGQSAKRVEIRGGKARARVEGSCKTCGSITITSGKWRRAQNPATFRIIDPQVAEERPDYLFGNPFTYDDPLAKAYGKCRFAHNEGFHGVLATRFGLNRGKRWFRRKAQVEIECAIIFSLMHVLSMEQRRRAQAKAPPKVKAA